MNDTGSLLSQGSTFFVYVKDNPKKSVKHKRFIEWLRKEGFIEERNSYTHVWGTYYINVNTKVYAWASSEVLLAPVIANLAIQAEDFISIYYILKKNEDIDHGRYHNVSELITMEEYQEYKEANKTLWKERQERYFSKNPTFQDWCEDVIDEVLNDTTYSSIHNGTREEIYEDFKDFQLISQLRCGYENKELPALAVATWSWWRSF